MKSTHFKIKDTKHIPHIERTTLELYHTNQFNSIKKKTQGISTLFEQRDGYNTLIKNTNNDILVGQYEQKRDRLEKEIHKLETEEPIYDYFLKTGDILFNYYNIQDRISSGENMSDNKSKFSKTNPGNVLSALSYKADNLTSNCIVSSISSISTNVMSNINSITSPIVQLSTITTLLGRDVLLENYLEIIDPNYSKKAVSEIDENISECKACGEEMIFSVNEALFNCPYCGTQEFILMDSDRPSYKDPPRETSYYAYKRINHFNELLAQFQAKESTDIPSDIFDNILLELKKERLTDMNDLKISKLREILRKLKYNKYYEHIPTIIYRLNGKNAPIMNRETEEKLRHMFKEIQPLFQKHCPKNRRNFLSYHYVLYKFCELLSMDEFLPSFPLLKNRDKLYQQDTIWKEICREMRWEFLKSV